jgi:cell fate (sporulation/competence/biofilm development) regulator YlbF (YheA/YmcA/DUF963 family)
MATTSEILNAARELGKLIRTHDAAGKFEASVAALQKDVEAQRVLNDYNRHLNSLAEKEASGRPIEVDDKRKLDQLQQKVIMNPLLQKFQMAQMDYLDLMRRVDEAMTGETEAAASGSPGPAASPLINPDMGFGKLS